MNIDEIISILRNPWGCDGDVMRRVRIEAADLLENMPREPDSVTYVAWRDAPVAAASAQQEQDRRDAVRYRWLRDAENGGDFSAGNATDFIDGGWERVDWKYGEELDAAIDAAMPAKQDGGKA